jgi:rhamnogalacturonyl hydrolase YesR
MLPVTLFVSSVIALTTSALARPSSYAVWAADSAIARKQGNGLSGSSPEVSYEHGEFQWALRLLYEKTGNTSYYNYIKAGVDEVVSSSGAVGGGYMLSDYSLDPVRVGPCFLYLCVLRCDTDFSCLTRQQVFQDQCDSV